MLEINSINGNSQNKNIDSHSYILIKSQNFVSTVKDEDNKHFLGSKNCIKGESNFIYESNFNNLDINNTHNNLNSHINEEIKFHNIIETINTEELFLKQKEKIKKYKERNIKNKEEKNSMSQNIKNLNSNKSLEFLNSINNKTINDFNILGKEKVNLHQKKNFNGTFKFLTLLDNYQFFEKAYFQKTKVSNKEDNIPILRNVEWKSLKFPIKKLEMKKLALRTINEINYETNMVQINLNFTLEGESELMIFTRSFVNKDVNGSFNFDNSSINYEPDIIFNKYSSLIKIIKEKYSNRCFITLGTFIQNSKNPNQISYKTFSKRQLVNFNDNINFQYLENDICEFYAYITDSGNENINVKIAMNSDNKFNYITGNFYLPINKRSKILFCGDGKSIIIKKLEIHNFDKNEEQEQQFEIKFSIEQKSCSCCNIF